MVSTLKYGVDIMAAAFTIYWTPQGWSGVRKDEPLTGAAGTRFEGKIAPGDRVFVTNVLEGRLRLLGAFDVERIQNIARDGKPRDALWDSPEYLIAKAGTATYLQFAELSEAAVKSMMFVGGRSSWRPTITLSAQRQLS